MIDRLTLVAEATGAIRHDAEPLSGPDGATEVGFTGQTEFTLSALGGVQRNDMVANGKTGYAFSKLNHYAAALMSSNRRKEPFGVIAR